MLLFILSTTSGKFIENQNNRTSKINKINIEGLSNNDNTKIYNQLNNLFSRNILFIHKEEIQEVLNKYNIIEEYSIKKIYPSTINIRIKPTKFIARLSSNDQLIGENGKLIEDRKNKDKLPYVFGKFNSKEFLSFRKNITQSQFTFTEFKMLYFFPSNRWDILTYNDILIKLPQGDIFKSLNLAHKIINMNNFNDKNIIDLRVKNHLIVK